MAEPEFASMNTVRMQEVRQPESWHSQSARRLREFCSFLASSFSQFSRPYTAFGLPRAPSSPRSMVPISVSAVLLDPDPSILLTSHDYLVS